MHKYKNLDEMTVPERCEMFRNCHLICLEVSGETPFYVLCRFWHLFWERSRQKASVCVTKNLGQYIGVKLLSEWRFSCFFLVGFVPIQMNFLANAVVSFVCAMQIQAFKKVHGYAHASTMCIGNMRKRYQSVKSVSS